MSDAELRRTAVNEAGQNPATTVPAREVLEQGLIYLINESILWPRGLALAYVTGDGAERLAIMDFGEPMTDGGEDGQLTARRLAALNAADRARYARFQAQLKEEYG